MNYFYPFASSPAASQPAGFEPCYQNFAGELFWVGNEPAAPETSPSRWLYLSASISTLFLLIGLVCYACAW